MLKKVLLMAAVALLGLPGLAHAQLGRGEISVGYGVAPVTDWIDAYSDKLLDVLDMKDASMDSWGGQLHLPYRRRVGCGRYFRLFG